MPTSSARRLASGLPAAVLAIWVFAVAAQTTNPFIGVWTVKGTSLAKGMPHEYQGKLELTADGGSWHMYGKGRDPCSSREVPVEIKSVDDKRLVATVKFSAIADYCKDSRLVLERDEQGRVTGRRGDHELTVSKQ